MSTVSVQKMSHIFGVLFGLVLVLSTLGFASVVQADGWDDSVGFDWGTYDYTPVADYGCGDCGSGFDWGTYDYTPAVDYGCGDCGTGFDWGTYDYTPSYGYSDPCYDCGYDYDSGCWDCGSYGGGYSMPSFGGGSYSMPRSYSTGGGYVVTPRSYSPAQPSGGGSQTQNQNQTQNTNVSVNNENTNTNTNINNNTAIAVAQVNLGGQTASYPSYPNYPTYPAPYCTINQAQYGSYGNYGSRAVYLSWNSSNAQSAYLSNYGSVAVNGSQTVYPTYTTTYTLTVYGYNGQQATCQTTVYANTYTPPSYTPTPYVSLTQIPYTGFDFGPFGNAMYWAGLAILALGGAYLAVFYIPQLAFARGSYKRTFAPVVAPKAPALLEKEAAEAKLANIVAALDKKVGTNDTMAIVQAKGSMPKIVIDRS